MVNPREKFIDIFLREWEMYTAKGQTPELKGQTPEPPAAWGQAPALKGQTSEPPATWGQTPEGGQTPEQSAVWGQTPGLRGQTPVLAKSGSDKDTFETPVQVGEIRVFAETEGPLVALVLGALQKDTYLVLPVSPFSVPATEQEILIGARVYQLWNSFTGARTFVEKSWVVEKLPEDDMRHLASALACVLEKKPLPEELAALTGLPITKTDDPRLDYEKAFAAPEKAHALAKAKVDFQKACRSRCWIYGLAASVIVLLGMVTVMIWQGHLNLWVTKPDCTQQPIPIFDLVCPPDAVEPMPARACAPAAEAPIPDYACADECLEEIKPPEEVEPPPDVDVNAAVDAMQNVRSPVTMKSVFGSRTTGIRGCITRVETKRRLGGSRVLAKMAAPVFAEPDTYARERYAEFKENEFVETKTNPLSTFGLDVDTASYATFRRYLQDMKRLPPKDSVRLEEYVNYFTYDYAGPTGDVPVAVSCELAACPWQPAHKLLRVALKAKNVAKEKLPPSNLVFLIDRSGSMSGHNGIEMAKSAMRILVNQLRPEDSVSIVTYADGTAVDLVATKASNKAKILAAVDALRAGGCTSGGAGIQLAYAEAQKDFDTRSNNRVILVTDGDFNMGVQSTQELVRLIERKRETGVFLSVLGVGYGNYRDEMMKKLANAGNGNYAYLDSILEAKKVLMNEFGGSMYTIAKDVKLQLEFNPAQTASYRLLGYECRKLAAKDFNDDKKDSGEMGVGHTMTAFYELVPAGATNAVAKTDPLKYQRTQTVASKELLTLKLRYKEPTGTTSRKIETPVVAEQIVRKDGPSLDFRFASAVAELALLLEDSKFKGNASYKAILDRARAAKGKDDNGARAEFIRLVEQAELIPVTKPNAPTE